MIVHQQANKPMTITLDSAEEIEHMKSIAEFYANSEEPGKNEDQPTIDFAKDLKSKLN